MKKLFNSVLLCILLLSVFSCMSASAVSDNDKCITLTPKITKYVYNYLDEVYIDKFPSMGLDFSYGSDADKAVLKTLAGKITKGLKSDKEKSMAIARWVKNNLEYRSGYEEDCAFYPIDVFYSRKGNCIGYGLLISELCRLCDIPSVFIAGTRGDMNSLTFKQKIQLEVGHAWTMIFYDDKWHLYDPLFDEYDLSNKNYISKWYFFDIIEGITPYIKGYEKYFIGEGNNNVYYINNRFVYYSHGMPATKYYDAAAEFGLRPEPLGYFAQTKYFDKNGVSDGFEYLTNPEKKASMINSECYTNGWISYGGGLRYAKANGILASSTTKEYNGIPLYITFDGSELILEKKTTEYTFINGFLGLKVGEKIFLKSCRYDEEVKTGRKYFYDFLEDMSDGKVKIDKNGVITGVKEGYVCIWFEGRNIEENSYSDGGYIELYVYSKERVPDYSSVKKEPDQVTGFTIKKTTDTKATLTWDNTKYAEQYYIYGRVEGESWKLLKKTTANSCTVDSLKSANKYSFKVRAVNGECKGKYSSIASAYTKPSVTKKITASQTMKTLTIKWSKVTGADGYRVYKYNSKTKKYEKLRDVTGTSIKISDLKSGTKYKFKVRAFINNDNMIFGEYSKEFETATKCKAPSITKLTTSKEKASFVWSDVSGESGYQVYYSTKKDSGYKKAGSYKANVVKGSKSKLKSGKTYYFKVRAYKKTDSGTVYSAWSKVKSIKVK